MNNKYKAVVLDLDGTLVDSLDDLADSVNRALAKGGYPDHSLEDYKYLIGNGMEQLVYKALPREVRENKEVFVQMLAEAKAQYNQGWAVKTQVYPGISQLLDSLAARNIALTILSNKPHEFTEQVVAKYLADWDFALVWGARPGIPKKPDPTSALMQAAELKLDPSHIMYLGDSGVDMETANKAGMYGVGALWGFRTEQELVECGAKALVARPLELLEIDL